MQGLRDLCRGVSVSQRAIERVYAEPGFESDTGLLEEVSKPLSGLISALELEFFVNQ